MLTSALTAFAEGKAAAAGAADFSSRLRLRSDFVLSRLLRLGRLPGYNARRRVRMRDALVVNYRLNRGDLQSLREVLVEEVYRCDLPAAPETILDLGANIGLASLWFARLIQPDPTGSDPIQPLKIIAVEPIPENAQLVELNFSENRIPGEVLQAAAGPTDGEAWFESRLESNLGRLVAEGDVKGPRIRVPVIGIHSLLARFPGGAVDLVKMDIEGGEAELLGGDTGWLRRVKMLIVEWHDDRADSAPLIRNVEASGFRHQKINTGRQDNLSLLVRI